MNTVAVSDTSPVSCLASIGRLDLLALQFKEVRVPPAVRRELEAYPYSAGLHLIEQALEQSLLKVCPVSNEHLVRALQTDLHRGEAEAIVLATEVRDSALLIDESDGRVWARRLGLGVVGTVGILLRGKLQGQLSSVGESLKLLQERYGFFIHETLYREVLQAAGEA